MQVVEFTPQVKVNPFSADIAELARITEDNERAAGQFVVPANEVGKSKFKIAKAANEINLTAALLNEETDKKGENVTLTYRLKPRHKSTTRKSRSTEATPEAVETTTE